MLFIQGAPPKKLVMTGSRLWHQDPVGGISATSRFVMPSIVRLEHPCKPSTGHGGKKTVGKARMTASVIVADAFLGRDATRQSTCKDNSTRLRSQRLVLLGTLWVADPVTVTFASFLSTTTTTSTCHFDVRTDH